MAKGYHVTATNTRRAGVEIDLLARKGPTQVLVEVKFRQKRDGAHVALHPNQRARLQKAAQALSKGKGDEGVRIDAILFYKRWPFIEHIKQAM